MEIQSTLSRIKRTERTFSCKVLRIDGVLRKMLIPSDAAALSSGGIAAENTKEVPLIRYTSKSFSTAPSTPIHTTYLVVDDDTRTSTETTASSQTVRKRADEHIYLRSLHTGVNKGSSEGITLHTGTLYSSVRPRPVLPTLPNETLSSRMSRYLYFCLSST